MRFSLVMLSGIVLHIGVCAQVFSVRNDHNGALRSEMGFKIFLDPLGYRIVQGGCSTANAFLRICFVDVSNTGVVSEQASYGRDSLSCFPGAANGPTLLFGDSYVCGGTDDGLNDRSVLWRFGSGPDSVWAAQIFPDSVTLTTGRVVRPRSGHLACSGEVWHGGQPGQLFLATVDTSGVLIDLHEYGTSVTNQSWSLDTCYDGGYVLGGDAWFTTVDHDAYVIKTDASGNELWHQYLGGPYRDLFASAIQTQDTNYVVVGGYSTFQSGSTDLLRLYAAKLNNAGGLEWEQQFGTPVSINALYSVSELSDGSFVAAGTYGTAGSMKGVLLHFAANGDSLWMRTYRHPPLDSVFSAHWLNHAVEDTDGSIVATGSCNDGQQDLWVIRVDSFGCLVPGCQLYDHVAEQPALPGEANLSILAYPNPASDQLAISFRSAELPKGSFHLVDATGRTVRSFKPTGHSEEIDLNIRPHPPGLYVLQYADPKGERWAQKIAIE